MVPDDLALKSFGYAPARHILHRYQVDETLLAKVFCVLIQRVRHDFPTKTLTVALPRDEPF